MYYRCNAYTHVGWITKLSLTIMLTLVFQQSGALDMSDFDIVDCGPPDAVNPCRHGNFSLNFNPNYCRSRIMCYKGFGEPCQIFGEISDCKEDLHCVCNRCSNSPFVWCRSQKFMQKLANRMQPDIGEYDIIDF